MPFGLGFFAIAGAGGARYFLSLLGGTAADSAFDVATDSTGAVYTFGSTASSGAGLADQLLVKRDTNGTLVWQRALGGTGTEEGRHIAIDNASNVYCVSRTNSQGAGNNDFLLTKYDTNGTLAWQRVIGTANQDNAFGLAIDGNSDVIISGVQTNNSQGLVAKYDPSGTVVWQRRTNVNSAAAYACSIGASNRIYLSMVERSQSVNRSASWVLNSDGTTFAAGNTGFGSFDLPIGNPTEMPACVTDTADRMTSVGYANDNNVIVHNFQNGTGIWAKALGYNSLDNRGLGIARGADGSLYVSGYTGNNLLILKYNASGGLLFQRFISGPGINRGNGIHIGTDNNIYVTGTATGVGAGDTEVFLAKLPSDGSLTGTYSLGGSNFTYGASGLTQQDAVMNNESLTITGAAAGMTASTSTLTTSTPTLTSTVTLIG